jgi:hypothetical protein
MLNLASAWAAGGRAVGGQKSVRRYPSKEEEEEFGSRKAAGAAVAVPAAPEEEEAAFAARAAANQSSSRSALIDEPAAPCFLLLHNSIISPRMYFEDARSKLSAKRRGRREAQRLRDMG